MAFALPGLPAGWPWSLWFFAATILLYLLQRFPITGVFLMVVGAAFWSILLINLGVIGIGVEAVTGKVSRLWLIVPLVYFGGYYWLYAREQAAFAGLRAEYAAFNDGKSLPFDPATQDLMLGQKENEALLSASSFVPHYGLKRAYDSNGRMALVGDAEACAMLRGNDAYRSAGVYQSGFDRDAGKPRRPQQPGLCAISAPGKPDRPIVRVTGESKESIHQRMPVTTQSFRLRDEASGREVLVKSGWAGPLKRFPMPVMGCALNSGGASWDCFAGFMRDSVNPIVGGRKFGSGAVIVAKALGLTIVDDYAPLATGPDQFRAIGEAADATLVAKETALLERMFADPTGRYDEGGFRHLHNKPEIIAGFADRLFAALGVLQSSDKQVSDTGSELWRLVASLPESSIAPHRAKLVEWLKPENARPWTEAAYNIHTRLDVTDPVQREIVLSRLETGRGDVKTNLLPQFCRLGASAPDDAKRRLLTLWHAKGRESAERRDERPQDHVVLYLTLARMGLKAQVGKVEQRYFGPTFLAIWDEVTPETHADACSGSAGEVSNYFSKRARERA